MELTYQIRIKGIVQGVGFRPFVYNLATHFDLTGYVLNDTQGVLIVAQGSEEILKHFVQSLQQAPPRSSRIESVGVEILETSENYQFFSIRESLGGTIRTVSISPDLDVCDKCLTELLDPSDRRYLYPFINCTQCGPRFTIIKNVPYDRPLTTMQVFSMCPHCQAEYDDPENRRFHAQPNACPECGPRLSLLSAKAEVLKIGGNAVAQVQIFKEIEALLDAGKILAIKGIGGFHLCCDARQQLAVSTLRQRKLREEKPFAVMFPALEQVERYCALIPQARALLQSTAHPIVLLQRRDTPQLAEAVAPGNRFIGAMLPYTPLHYLLLHFYPYPLVMTSGNVSDEPIAYQNDFAFQQLAEICDYFLIHNRDIHIRCDDSVMRIQAGLPYPIRRSRGYAPQPIQLEWEFSEPVLACGPEQKNCFALAQQNRVFLSQHIGDMENYEVLNAIINGINHLKHIFDIEPSIVAYDLHPDYLSTKYALDLPYINTAGQRIHKIGVQHHHAHAVSCMAENGINAPVIAITLDGTGFGTDATIWGGEILEVEYHQFRRLGYFEPVSMPGGRSAIDHPWQMAVSYLYQLYGPEFQLLELPFLNDIPTDQLKLIMRMLELRLNCPVTSSCGRLFDAVAALCNLRLVTNYEGQAAVELEQCVQESVQSAYPFDIIEKGDMFVLRWQSLIQAIISDVEHATESRKIAANFHNGLADGLLRAVQTAYLRTGHRQIILSGGVFMNIYLLERLKLKLLEAGFEVFTHRLVPANDGGIALGQAVIASAKMKKGLE
jgi:hydrogenase maturation protein HypF